MKNKTCARSKPESARDRFIMPSHSSQIEKELQQAKYLGIFNKQEVSNYTNELAYSLWDTSYDAIHNAPILGFTMPNRTTTHKSPRRTPLKITEGKALDAIELINNVYANPICWGDQVYIGLHDSLYSYNHASNVSHSVSSGCLPNSVICSLAYGNNRLLRSGSDNSLQVIDTPTNIQIKLHQEAGLFQSMAHDGTQGMYLLNNKDKEIFYCDFRSSDLIHLTSVQGEVFLSLAFNELNSTLALSSNPAHQLYDVRRFNEPRLRFKAHDSPSKALSFSPGRGDWLATGGGISDHKLNIWNIQTGDLIYSANAGNQITNIHWVNNTGLFVCEGFTSNRVSSWSINQTVTKDNQCQKMDQRVLFAAQNPKNETEIVTGSGDEQIRFWSVKRAKPEISSSKDTKFTENYTIR